MARADAQQPIQVGNDPIRVSVRLRPLNHKEASRNEAIDWQCIHDTTIVYNNNLSPERSLYPNTFSFDRVFSSHCSTRQVYEEGAKSVVLSAVSGINSSVFAYGQTSSGKTFTMSGITEYTMVDIFDYIQTHKERVFHLKFSAMEIYNESVRDLLTTDNSPLRLLDDPERGTVVEKLTEETLHDWVHFRELLAMCEAQRQIGETFLNEASSRSHQILRLTIESSTRECFGKNNCSTLAATLNFVDLAGSERASQALSAGSRLKEGSHINRSLLTLGTVIRKLSKGETGHIPYRDSKLTRILQSSLGGNARTAIICTMSPARSYVEQSRNTLLFASCAKDVTTDARVNVVMSDKALVKHLQRELVRLESELRSASPSVRSDATDTLKEKDFKIDELERRLKELTLQLDLALYQIHSMQQRVGEQSLVLLEEESSCASHVRQALEGSCSNTITLVDRHSCSRSLASEIPQSPDRQSRLSYDENYSYSDFDENQLPSSPFEEIIAKTPSEASPSTHAKTFVVVGNDYPQVLKEFSEQTTSLPDDAQYIVSEEPGSRIPNSFNTDLHCMSEKVGVATSDTFEILIQQNSDRNGSQSSYTVEFDPPYQVSVDFGQQTPGSNKVDQYHVSKGFVERNHNYEDIDSLKIPGATRYQVFKSLEEYCKEVQCVESENVQVKSWSPKEERKSLLLTSCENDRCTYDVPKQDIELANMNLSLLDSGETLGRHLIHDTCSISQTYNSLSQEEMKYEVKDEREVGECLCEFEHSHIKLSVFSNDSDCGVLQLSSGDTVLDETPVADVEVTVNVDIRENHTSHLVPKEAKSVDHVQPQYFKDEDSPSKESNFIKNKKDVGLNPRDDLDDSSSLSADVKLFRDEDSPPKESNSIKNMKDVGLNPQDDLDDSSSVSATVKLFRDEDSPLKESNSIKNMKDVGLNPQDDLDDSSSLSADVSSLRREIIDLWDACNISLVHRTKFFLLFLKDELADIIYMEVERRRLSHIKDAFSWENSVVLDGCHLTPDSSKRSLLSERKMFSNLLKRRFSSQERMKLYERWGISLNSKRRRCQLAHRLWDNSLDMESVTESAKVVAKLVQFSEPQNPKEVFGLNLTSCQGQTQGRRMSFGWTCKNAFLGASF